MHTTLHLTQRCNLRCKYCYVHQNTGDMDFSTAKKAIEMFTEQGLTGIVFFGGEPLLKKDLIYRIVEFAEDYAPDRFHYKITTNGVLLDEKFVDYAEQTGIIICLSHDGIEPAHDFNRVYPDGKGTFEQTTEKLEMLIARQPYAPILMVLDALFVDTLTESVEFFLEKGVKYLIISLNYAGAWNDKRIKRLRKEFKKLAAVYEREIRAENKIYISPFDKRFNYYIWNLEGTSCNLGYRQISVAPDGTFYPCVQFVGRREYAIGSANAGINEAKRKELFLRNQIFYAPCEECALKERCHNRCACLNMQVTGNPFVVPAVLCEVERTIIPIVDALGNKLYKERVPLFMQKHYNPLYPFISYLEDISL